MNDKIAFSDFFYYNNFLFSSQGSGIGIIGQD